MISAAEESAAFLIADRHIIHRGDWMMWELVGAVVGAGLASGREIAAFFSRYGWMSFAGIGVTGMTLFCLGSVSQPIRWPHLWLERLWHILLTAMLIVTGGAMLAGAGEIGGILLPVHAASFITQGTSLLLAWLLAKRYSHGLTVLSKMMIAVLGSMMIGVLFTQSKAAVVVTASSPTMSLVSGVMYGGFNAALQAPLLSIQSQNRRRVLWASIILCGMLALGNVVLLRNPVLLSEPMPFLAAVRTWGRLGYLLYAVCLYLAILSTLTACTKGLHSVGAVVMMALMSQLSFSGVVDVLYPVLGGGCFVLLVCAKFSKTGSRPFHSRHDVL